MSELGIMFMNHDMSIGVQVFFSPAQTPQLILFYYFFFMNKDRYRQKLENDPNPSPSSGEKTHGGRGEMEMGPSQSINALKWSGITNISYIIIKLM